MCLSDIGPREPILEDRTMSLKIVQNRNASCSIVLFWIHPAFALWLWCRFNEQCVDRLSETYLSISTIHCLSSNRVISITIKCRCLEQGFIQYVLLLFGRRKIVLMIDSLCSAHFQIGWSAKILVLDYSGTNFSV